MKNRRSISGIAGALAAAFVLLLVCVVLQPGADDAPQLHQNGIIADIFAGEIPVGESRIAESPDGEAADGESPADGSAPASETLYDANGAAYEAGAVLVGLPAGADPEQALAAIAEETGIDGLAISNVSAIDGGASSLVEVRVPAGVDTQEAVRLIGASSAADSVQPNYVYHTQGGDAGGDRSGTGAAEAVGTLALTVDGTLAHGLIAQATTVNDPYVSKQWALQSVYAYGDTSGAGNAWDVAKTDGAVTVAVIDEGFSKAHPDLAANVVEAYNAADKSSDVSEVRGEGGHGTHVAGIVGAVANNGKGVAGVSHNARLMLVKITDSEGTISSNTVVSAIDYIISKKAAYNIRVISMSLGAGQDSMESWGDDAAIQAIDRACAAGIAVVCSAGNEYTDGNSGRTWTVPFINYPSDYKNVISVINLAHTGSDAHAVYRSKKSNYNLTGTSLANMPTGKNISAPGTDIYSTLPSSKYGDNTGTSMAAPCVAGALALAFTAHPDLSVSEATSLLYSTATDVASTGEGWDRYTGYGEVNAYGLVARGEYLSGTPSVQVGKTTVLTPSSSGEWTWTTSDERIAIVSDGVVSGVAAGSARITARGVVDGKPKTLDQIVVVYDPQITGASSVGVGLTAQLKVDGSPSGGWLWTTSDASAVTVNANGVVKGVKLGASAVITATLSDNPLISARKTIKVARISLSKAGVTAPTQFYTGHALKPAPTVMLSGKKLKKGTDYTVSYKNNKKVGAATVTVKGKGAYKGTASGTFFIIYKPKCTGATRIPVGATATYTVSNGSIAIKSGDSFATLSGEKLTAKKAGTVVLSICDKAGLERATKKVTVYPLTGSWTLQSATNRSYVLDVAGASHANGANVQVYHANGTTAQRFKFKLQSDGTFRVTCAASGKVLDVAGGSKEKGANVQQWSWGGVPAQRWRLSVDASNRVTLTSKVSGMALAVSGKAVDGRNVWQRPSSSSKTQKWVLVKA